jgi:hypothetical protein
MPVDQPVGQADAQRSDLAALPPDVLQLAQALLKLPEAQRAALAAMLGQTGSPDGDEGR